MPGREVSIVGAGRYILSAFLVLILTFEAHGSSIVVMRNDSEIIIGTDSKRQRASRDDLSDAVPESVCKIVKADNVFIASAGIVGIGLDGRRDKISEFDLNEIMSKAALGTARIYDKAEATAEAVERALFRIYGWMKDKRHDLFERMFLGRQSLQVVIAGFDGTTPVLFVMAFEPGVSASGELKINRESRPCPGAACPDGYVYIFMGKHDAIDKHLTKNPGIWANSPVAVVRELIEVEAVYEPEAVGPPIDILRITKDGFEWIQEKEICEERP